MTLEVLSEAEINRLRRRIDIRGTQRYDDQSEFIFDSEDMEAALNTIKLQRQQLAEQERKIRQECLQEFIMLFIKPDEHSAMMYSKAQYELLVKRILKPESEASGE